MRFTGLPVMFVGVAVFGVYFVGGNARAARSGDGAIPATSWLGAGPMTVMAAFALGSFMLLCAFVLAKFLPNGV
jgi:hypothetical protein